MKRLMIVLVGLVFLFVGTAVAQMATDEAAKGQVAQAEKAALKAKKAGKK